MNRIAKVSLKILKWVGIVILSLVALFFATRWIGQGVNKTVSATCPFWEGTIMQCLIIT